MINMSVLKLLVQHTIFFSTKHGAISLLKCIFCSFSMHSMDQTSHQKIIVKLDLHGKIQIQIDLQGEIQMKFELHYEIWMKNRLKV